MSNETTLTPAQIDLVKQTWSQVVPIADTAAKMFYDRLFETSPQLAPLFAGVDLPAQRQKLVKAINTVVLSLDRIETQLPMIRESAGVTSTTASRRTTTGRSAPHCWRRWKPASATPGRTMPNPRGRTPTGCWPAQ